MLSKKLIEFSTNNRLQINKMVSNRMLLHSLKVINQTNKTASNQTKFKCLHKTKVKFQDKKSSKLPQGLTIEQLQQQRDTEMKQISGNRPPAF